MSGILTAGAVIIPRHKPVSVRSAEILVQELLSNRGNLVHNQNGIMATNDINANT